MDASVVRNMARYFEPSIMMCTLCILLWAKAMVIARMNERWGMIPRKHRVYDRCHIEVDSSLRCAELPQQAKDDMAQSHSTWETRRHLLSDAQRPLLTVWNTMEPPDAWAKERLP
jgi:endonuclease I